MDHDKLREELEFLAGFLAEMTVMLNGAQDRLRRFRWSLENAAARAGTVLPAGDGTAQESLGLSELDGGD